MIESWGRGGADVGTKSPKFRHVVWSDVTATRSSWSVVVEGDFGETLGSKKGSFLLGENLGVLDRFVDAKDNGFFAFGCEFATANVVVVVKITNETTVVALESEVELECDLRALEERFSELGVCELKIGDRDRGGRWRAVADDDLAMRKHLDGPFCHAGKQRVFVRESMRWAHNL